ncbi:MAG: response regulator transcription factor [Polaribacter sp.]|jgi:DNA-binding NarL/FixJ family response regulator
MGNKIKVHIADDHKILIEGIIALIKTDDSLEVDGYSLTGKELLDWVSKNEIDVLILDISMPVIDGIEVLKYLKRKNIPHKTILLSSYDDVQIVKKVLQLGALGYLSKSSASQHLLKAIKTVINNDQYFSNDIQKDLLYLYGNSSPKKINAKDLEIDLVEPLTEREIEVLKLIAKEYNSIEIADLLIISKHTVESHRKSILRKLNVKNSIGIAMFAVKHNMI